MDENQRFTKATDWIKFQKGASFKEIAERIAIDPARLTNIRRNVVAPSQKEVEFLIKEYPGVSQFFTEKNQRKSQR